jgi:large subunit ribosomal protein L15
MSLTELFKDTKYKQAKRVGRGIAAGGGKTAGRGTKGQKSRAGANRKIKPWFEGGQTPLFRKMAKQRGFRRHVAKPFVLTTSMINHFYTDKEVVSPTTLLEKGVVRKTELKAGVKVVNRGKLTREVTFEAVELSSSLRE